MGRSAGATAMWNTPSSLSISSFYSLLTLHSQTNRIYQQLHIHLLWYTDYSPPIASSVHPRRSRNNSRVTPLQKPSTVQRIKSTSGRGNMSRRIVNTSRERTVQSTCTTIIITEDQSARGSEITQLQKIKQIKREDCRGMQTRVGRNVPNSFSITCQGRQHQRPWHPWH